MLRTTTITSLLIVITMAISHDMMAQCISTFPAIEDFESTTGVYSWSPVCTQADNCGVTAAPYQFNVDFDFSGGWTGNNISSHDFETGDHIIENCYDVSTLAHPRLKFQSYSMDIGGLELQASEDNGTTWTTVWSNITTAQGPAGTNVSLIEYKNASTLNLRFVSSSVSIIDNIEMSEALINLSYAYDLAGNRTTEDLIVNLIDEEEVLARNLNVIEGFVSDESPEMEIASELRSEKTLAASDISVFPNPTEGIVRVSISGDAESYSMSLLNSMGQLILDKPLQSSQEIDISAQLAGLYYIIISSLVQKDWYIKLSRSRIFEMK